LKIVYYTVFICFYYYLYYSRIIAGTKKLNYTLDTYFKHNKPSYLKKHPLVDTKALDLSEMDNTGICSWQKQTLSWHFAIDGVFRPLYWFNDSCDKDSMNTGMNLTIYTDLMKKSGENIIAFQNIDRIKYPASYDFFNAKIMRLLQKEVMSNMHTVTEKEMMEGSEEIFLDFRGEENKEIGKLEIKVKDRRIEYPEMAKRLKDVDVSKGKFNILNLFVDETSRGRFFRVFPKTIEYLTDLKNRENSPIRLGDFSKFHSIEGFTYDNLIASSYGIQGKGWKQGRYYK
jgi:hypothetical protein